MRPARPPSTTPRRRPYHHHHHHHHGSNKISSSTSSSSSSSANKQQMQQQQQQQTDSFHNRLHHPSCLLLANLACDILPPMEENEQQQVNDATTTATTTSFPVLLRQQLLQSRYQVAAAAAFQQSPSSSTTTTATSSSSPTAASANTNNNITKKKRKKKKKKSKTTVLVDNNDDNDNDNTAAAAAAAAPMGTLTTGIIAQEDDAATTTTTLATTRTTKDDAITAATATAKGTTFDASKLATTTTTSNSTAAATDIPFEDAAAAAAAAADHQSLVAASAASAAIAEKEDTAATATAITTTTTTMNHNNELIFLDRLLDQWIMAKAASSCENAAAAENNAAVVLRQGNSNNNNNNSNNTLRDFVHYLQQHYEPTVVTAATAAAAATPDNDNTSLPPSPPSTTTSNPKAMLQISNVTLQQCLNQIACTACRRDVEKVGRKMTTMIGGRNTKILFLLPDLAKYKNKHATDNPNDGKAEEEEDNVYVCMEEGLTTTTSQEGWYWVPRKVVLATALPPQQQQKDDSSSLSFSWQIEYRGNTNTNNNNNNNKDTQWCDPREVRGHHAPVFWTLPNLEWMVRNLVLLKGLPLDRLLGLTTATTTATTSNAATLVAVSNERLLIRVRNIVRKKCHILDDDFQTMSERLEEQVAKFAHTAHHDAGGNIETQAGTIMFATDEVCCQVIDGLFSVLKGTTKMLQGMLHRLAVTSSSKQERDVVWKQWLEPIVNMIDDMWLSYAEGVQTIVTEIAIYENQAFELANAQGAIISMFCSATLRTLYRQLVERKIEIVDKMKNEIYAGLHEPVSMLLGVVPDDDDGFWNVHLYRYLVVEDTFQKLLAESSRPSIRRLWRQRFPLDFAMEDALTELREWTETVQKQNTKQIMEVHVQRREKLMRLLQNVEASVSELVAAANVESSVATTTTTGGEQSSLDMLRQHVKVLQEGPIDPDMDNPEDILNITRAHVGNGIVLTVRSWIKSKFEMPQDDELKPLAAEIPPFLRRAMVLDCLNRSDEGPCLGGVGTSRFESIMVALLFQWMRERFHEWQAQIAEQELLTKLQDDEKEALERGAKASKKSKKKKTKKEKALAAETVKEAEGTAKEVIAVENVRETKDTNESEALVQQRTEGVKENKQNATAHMSIDSSHATVGDQIGKNGEQTKSDRNADNGLASKNSSLEEKLTRAPKKNETLGMNSTSSSGEENEKNAATNSYDTKVRAPRSQVGVIDKDGFQSAEEFLVGRLVAVLKTTRNTAIIN